MTFCYKEPKKIFRLIGTYKFFCILTLQTGKNNTFCANKYDNLFSSFADVAQGI